MDDSDLLLRAVENDDVGAVKKLLRKKVNINTRDRRWGLTPLMIAAGHGNKHIVKLLLDAGADVFMIDPYSGASALHKSCHSGNFQIFKMLVDAGASVEWLATSTAHTLLFEAVWFKRADFVEYLLKKNVGLNMRTRYGLSLKEHFTETQALNMKGKDALARIARLLNQRWKADEKKVKDQKLMAAVIRDDIKAVRRLISSGVDIDERSPVVNGPNDRHTPLLVACREGRTQIVRELIKAGADVNAMEPTFGAVPLHKAVYNGHVEITRMLAQSPGIDLDFQGATNSYTPLHDAIWHGFADCAAILVEAGARLDLKGDDGKVALLMAKEVFGVKHKLVRLIESKINKK